jgi:hypothetical protein
MIYFLKSRSCYHLLQSRFPLWQLMSERGNLEFETEHWCIWTSNFKDSENYFNTVVEPRMKTRPSLCPNATKSTTCSHERRAHAEKPILRLQGKKHFQLRFLGFQILKAPKIFQDKPWPPSRPSTNKQPTVQEITQQGWTHTWEAAKIRLSLEAWRNGYD